MVGVYKIIYKKKNVYKYLQYDNEVGIKLIKRLKNKQELLFFNEIIKNIHNEPFIGKFIVKGQPIGKPGDYTSPIIDGILLSKIFHNQTYLNFSTTIQLIYAIDLLLSNLQFYFNKYNFLIGDWVLHNLIWNISTNYIINIDLEGFYTYSNRGLDLSWQSNENNINKVKQSLNNLKYKLFTYLIKINKIKKCNSILNINFPNNKCLWIPNSKYINYSDWIINNSKVIIIDNNTYKTIYINFKRKQSYMIIKNSNKPLLNKYMKREFFKLILHH